MDEINKKSKEELMRDLKPAGSYIDSLAGFQDLLGTIKQAENAAKELLSEADKALIEKKAPPRFSTAKESSGTGDTADSDNPEGETQENGENGRAEIGDRTESGDTAEKSDAAGSSKTPEELLETLDALVGLENIKKSVKSLINFVKVRKLREENGLPNPPVTLHMVFTGNPGTGKTTVARILSELYKAIGVLSKGQLVEVDRSGLVAGFVGQTAIKTAEAVNSALGGILFIDEAYALAPDAGMQNDFGREAIETLLKLMEDYRNDLIVIVAGYTEPMERFITSNPGLESRFNRYFTFDDYNSEQLYDIFTSMCAGSEYLLTDEAKDFARGHFTMIYTQREENFGNARHVRNFFENIVTVHSDRVSALNDHTRDDLTMVILDDLKTAAEM